MATLFMDSFDMYGVAADLLLKWSQSTQVSGGIALGTGRSGSGQCVTLTSVAGQVLIARYLGVNGVLENKATVIVGFYFKASALDNGDKSIVYFVDNSGATFQAVLAYNTSGQLEARRGTTSGVVLGTSTPTITAGVWHHIEVKFTCHASTGAFIVKLDGVEVINYSGDTNSNGNNSLDTVWFYSANTASQTKSIDDLFILDTAGSLNNDWLGQCSVKALHPDGAGAVTQWTPSAGSNFQCVDDAAQNGDTDFVSTATASNKDLYAFGNTGASDTPLAVEVAAVVRKDDATVRTLAPTMRSNATDVDGATVTLTTTYDYAELYRDTDPNTSAAWTKAGVDALQAGVKAVS